MPHKGPSTDGVDPRYHALAFLFHGTMRSYLSIKTPWSGFTDETLVVRQLDQAGQQGQAIFQLSNEIGDLAKRSKTLHLEMLYDLFRLMYGETDQVVTSEQLLATGFDDSKEPKISDYD